MLSSVSTPRRRRAVAAAALVCAAAVARCVAEATDGDAACAMFEDKGSLHLNSRKGADVVLNGVGFGTVAGNVDTHAATIRAMQRVITEQNSTLHAQGVQIVAQQGQLGAQDRAISDHAKAMSTLKETVHTQNVTINSQATQITTLKTTNAVHTTQIASLQTDVSTHTKTISSQATVIKTLEKTSEKTATTVTTLEKTVNAVQTTIQQAAEKEKAKTLPASMFSVQSLQAVTGNFDIDLSSEATVKFYTEFFKATEVIAGNLRFSCTDKYPAARLNAVFKNLKAIFGKITIGHDKTNSVSCNGPEGAVEFAKLEHVAGDLTVKEASYLTSIKMPSLKDVRGQTSITRNKMLKAVDFPEATHFFDLRVSVNNAVESITAPKLKTCGKELEKSWKEGSFGGCGFGISLFTRLLDFRSLEWVSDFVVSGGGENVLNEAGFKFGALKTVWRGFSVSDLYAIKVIRFPKLQTVGHRFAVTGTYMTMTDELDFPELKWVGKHLKNGPFDQGQSTGSFAIYTLYKIKRLKFPKLEWMSYFMYNNVGYRSSNADQFSVTNGAGPVAGCKAVYAVCQKLKCPIWRNWYPKHCG